MESGTTMRHLSDKVSVIHNAWKGNLDRHVEPNLAYCPRSTGRTILQVLPESPMTCRLRPVLITLMLPGLVVATLVVRAESLPETVAEELREASTPFDEMDDVDAVGSERLDALDLFDVRRDGHQSVEAMAALGRIKQQTGEYREAIAAWEEALDLIQTHHGRWDERKVAALAGIAAGFRGMGLIDEALEYYAEAVYVNRMNHGLHDASQLPLLDRITELHALRDEWDEANQLQEYAFYVHQRLHGNQNPEILPAMYRMARWYQSTGAVLSARDLYERAIGIVEQTYGKDDIRLVEPLQQLAQTYRHERYPVVGADRDDDPSFRITTGRSFGPREPQMARTTLNPYGVGERALVRATELQIAHPDTTATQKADALKELADWYLLFDKWNQSMDTYAEARDVLSASGLDDQQIAEKFAKPVPLVFPVPSPPSPPPWTEGVRSAEGYVDMTYDVTSRGRVRNLSIEDSKPEGLLDFRMRKAVRAARFRPQFVDGKPVDTEGVEYRHRFVYYEERARAEPVENDDT